MSRLSPIPCPLGTLSNKYVYLNFILQYIYIYIYFFSRLPTCPFVTRPNKYIFSKIFYRGIYIFVFFLPYFYSAYPYLVTKNKINAAVYTCPVCRSRQVCPVCRLDSSVWPAYTLPIRHLCQ